MSTKTADKTNTRPNRRALLATAAAAMAGATAVKLTAPGTAEAAFDVAIDNNAGSAVTRIHSTAEDIAFVAYNPGGLGDGRGGLLGRAGDINHVGPPAPAGVTGESTVAEGYGVYGHQYGNTGAGVRGQSQNASGVWGLSFTGVGVLGQSDSPTGVGVRAEHIGEGNALEVSGPSVLEGDLAVTGVTTLGGLVTASTGFKGNGTQLTALKAENMTLGTLPETRLSLNIVRKNSALNVFTGAIKAKSFSGKLDAADLQGSIPDAQLSSNVPLKGAPANTFTGNVVAKSFQGPGAGAPAFKTSGIVTVLKNKTTVRVSNTAVTPLSKVLVTVQSDIGGADVKHLVKGAGFFDIVFTKATGKAGTIAWLVLA